MTSFFEIYSNGLFLIIAVMTLLWLVSIFLKNASIVDAFWGIGFIILSGFYISTQDALIWRKWMVLLLVLIWGIRLSVHIFIRNYGKGEDIRYQNFRKNYGIKRYWWVSFFQVFVLQGILLWLVSAPLLGTFHSLQNHSFSFFDLAGILFWIIGMLFEIIGDAQLKKFRRNPENKGKLFDSGLRHYTRYPQYFGEAMIWWGFGMLSIASGNYFTLFSPALMMYLLYYVSGVKMMDKYLEQKPGYQEYMKRTNSFWPWFPKK